MTGRPCPHGDSMCPCNDGDACNYEDVWSDGVLVSPGSPCRNDACPSCRSGA